MTCHVLHAGDGYTYLIRQVATGDLARAGTDPLVAYYQAAGNPPGQWAGSACADLGMAGEVTEEHMLALFGEGLRPDANDYIADRIAAGDTFDQALRKARLGRRFAQYDADNPLLRAIKTAYGTFERDEHRRPTVDERRDIKETLARAELRKRHPCERAPKREAVQKFLVDELGKARQPVAGFDLVFSPVKSVSLLWALGGHRIRTIVEEIHEAAWRAALAFGEREGAFTRIGAGGIAQVPTSGFAAVAFQHRDSRAGDPDLHTHVTISNRVLAEDGTWRTIDGRQLFKIAVTMSEIYNSAIEQGTVERLGAEFIDIARADGKRVVREIVGMPLEWRQGFSRRRGQVEAGYETLVRDYVRQHGRTPPRSVQMKLAQQAALQDRPVKTELVPLAEQVAGWHRRAREMTPDVPVATTIAACLNRDPAGERIDVATAAAVIDRVSAERSTWTIYHVHAEAQRQLRPVRFPDAAARAHAVDALVDTALSEHSIRLDLDIDAVPRLLQRQPDDESVFVRRGSRRFTSEAILSAEDRLVLAAETRFGPVVSEAERNQAIARFANATGTTLNPGQRALVEHFVSGGRAVAVAIGPPGTGKSTAMAAVREAWNATGNRVIGLGPSAASASVLGDELGIRATTLHMLLEAHRAGEDTGLRRGDMVLVDEAGMAGTILLDEIRHIAAKQGAVLRLVGDYRQLPAVGAGGALRELMEVVGGIELSEVHRFVLEEEAEAVLQLRVGDERCVDFYANNDRLVGGVRAASLDALYVGWQRDRDSGRASIMISDSNDVVRDLSQRAQTELRTAGLVAAAGVALHDDNVAGIGDLVVTRRNKRRLTVNGGKDYVKNGDLWSVENHLAGGRMRLRHLRHGGLVILPAWYVEQYVELGYAATVHRSQGLTVEMSRCFLTPAATREAALVALSRGTHGNYAYLDTEQLLSTEEPHVLPGDLFYRNRETTDAAAALLAILRHEGAELSASAVLRDALDGPYRLSDLVPQFSFGLHIHRGRDAVAQAEQWVRAAVPDFADDIVADEAWPALQQVLHEVHDTGTDPVRLLSGRAMHRELESAISVAKVLHFRVVEKMPVQLPGPHRPDLLPGWVPSPPGATDFPAASLLSETARTKPSTSVFAEHTVGGPGPAQLLLFAPLVDDVDDTRDDDQLGLFAVVEPGETGVAEEYSARFVELGGPDPAQLLLFPAPDTQALDVDGVDPVQFALFSADAPRHQADRMELGGWLNDRAELIADRVQVLGERAAENPPVWAAALGEVPIDPIGREQWIANAGQVAAYRERWEIPADVAELLPSYDRGEQGRARAWVETYLNESAMPPTWNPTSRRPAGQPAPATGTTPHPAGWADAVQARAQRRAEQQLQQEDRDARDRQRRDDAARVLRETWRHEPALVEAILAAAAFPAFARHLADAAAAGYDLRDVLADIRLDATSWSTLTDPAAYAARAVDRVVERLRGGAPTASERAAHRRDQQEELARLRAQATDLLAEVWPGKPELVAAITGAPAFDTFARTIGRHTDAGLDVHDLLANLSVGYLERETVRDKAAYATYALNKILDRYARVSDAARARDAARVERRETLHAAAQLLRRAWAGDLDAAEHVIGGPVFDILADRMAAAADNGHDVDAILTRLDPAVLTAHPAPPGSTIIAFGRAIAADRDRVTDPQPGTSSGTQPTATLPRGPAQPPADEHARLITAEDALRELWTADADWIISSQTHGVERLAVELDKARQAGYDPADFLRAAALASGRTRLLQPNSVINAPAGETVQHAATIYEPGIPHPGEPGADPAGASAVWVRDHLANHIDAHPRPAVEPATAPTEPAPELDPRALDVENDVLDVGPAGMEPGPGNVEMPAPQPEHWTAREFGALSDDALHTELAAQHARTAQLAQQRAQVEAAAEDLAAQVTANTGPAVSAVDREIAEVREQSRAVDEALRVEEAWHTVSEHAAHVAGERARAQHELGAPGRISRARRAELARTIDELAAAEQVAHIRSAELAEDLAQKQRSVGPPERYPQIRILAQTTERNYEHDRAAARSRDVDAAADARHHVDRIAQAERDAAAQQRALEAEYAVRDSLVPDAAQLERAERLGEHDPAPALGDTESDLSAPGVAVRDVEQILQQAEPEVPDI